MLKQIGLVVPIIVLLQSCTETTDLDQTEPNIIKKTMLDGEWHHRSTLIDKQSHSGFAFSGLECDIERLKFQITENQLLAFRSYENGKEGEPTNRNQTLVAAFAIAKHFDIDEKMSAENGILRKVTFENDSKRPWWQRDFMRVVWDANLAPHQDCNEWIQSITKATVSTDMSPSAMDPHRVRVEDGYLEATIMALVTPDEKTCEHISEWACQPAQYRVKFSFRKMPEQNDYQPKNYLDNIPLRFGTNKNGICFENEPECENLRELWLYQGARKVEVCDPKRHNIENCVQMKVDMNAQFGFFRTETQTYDRMKGYAKEGRQQLINRWNIWQKSLRDDGTEISLEERIPKKISYYLNAGFPKDLVPSTQKVARDWSTAFANVVAQIKNQCTLEQVNAYIDKQQLGKDLEKEGISVVIEENIKEACKKLAEISRKKGLKSLFFSGNPEEILESYGPLFEIRMNDCNTDKVHSYASANGLEDELSKHGFSSITDENLENACAMLEWMSKKKKSSPPFEWQRLGDLRYSFVNGIQKLEEVGLLGYGPTGKDPLTGEILNGNANMYLAELGQYAGQSVDLMEQAYNDRGKISKVSSGQKNNAEFETFSNAVEIGIRNTQEAEKDRQVLTHSFLDNLHTIAEQSFSIGHKNDASKDPFAAFSGKNASKNAPIAFIHSMLGGMGAQKERSIPAEKASLKLDNLRERVDFFGSRSACFMTEGLEPPYALLQQKLKGSSFEEKYRYVRERIFESTLAHELGHTFGLRHNFKGAYDALNFPPNFWGVNTNDFRMRDGLHKEELRSASIMDYHMHFNSDFSGIGLYDYAALLAGYGDRIEVFDEREDEFVPKDWYDRISVMHYKDLPYLLAGRNANQKLNEHLQKVQDQYWLGDAKAFMNPQSLSIRPKPENMYKRRTIPFEQFRKETFYQVLGVDGSLGKRTYSVPYAYCSDRYSQGSDLSCNPFIMGSSAEEIVENAIQTYEATHFLKTNRGQRAQYELGAYLGYVYNKVYEPILLAYQSMYQSRGGALRMFPFARDYTLAAQKGLDFIAKVLQTPEPGIYCKDAEGNFVLRKDADACADPIEIGRDQGKPYHSKYQDMEGQRLESIGFIYDKILALVALTDDRVYLTHTFSAFQKRNYSAGFYRLFAPELSNLFSSYFLNDWKLFSPSVHKDENGKTVLQYQSLLHEPKKASSKVDSLLKPSSSWPLRYYAILLGMAGLNSASGLGQDFAKRAQITVLDSRSLTHVAGDSGTIIFTDPTTGIRYMALAPKDGEQRPGYRLLQDASAFVSEGGNNKEDGPWYKAKKRLEQARTKKLLALSANGPQNDPAIDPDLADMEMKDAEEELEKQTRLLHQKIHVIDMVKNLSELLVEGR